MKNFLIMLFLSLNIIFISGCSEISEITNKQEVRLAIKYCKQMNENLDEVRAVHGFNQFVCTQTNKDRNKVGHWLSAREITLEVAFLDTKAEYEQ